MAYAVILAGGAGRRLWPLSRETRPKQLLPLIHGKSLLQLAVERLQQGFAPERIMIATGAEYADQIKEAVPSLPVENIIGEPTGRDTANAVGLAAAVIARRDPDAVMAVFTADHIIRPAERFNASVAKAVKVVEQNPDALVTFGIKPSWPHTGLGYIQRGEKVADSVYEVEAFKEKPDHHRARRYVESGEYYWNSGMFVWQVSTILDALKSYLPDSAEKLIAAAESPDLTAALREVYPTLEKISIDFAVMEKSPNVMVVELDCDWLDVGSWPALAEVSDIDEGGNTVVSKQTALLDGERNIIVTEEDHLIAVLGMDDCIVVHSPDATLVCHRNESQRLKELVALIQQKYGQKFL